jgi:hypothetical protein
MTTFTTLLAMATLWGIMSTAPVAAADVTWDFENGLPADWKLSSGPAKGPAPVAELRKYGDNTVLQLGRGARMQIGDKPYLNFAIEATIRREVANSTAHAGFEFRNGYRAYLRKPGQIELSGPDKVKGLGFTRNLDTVKPVRLRIVVAGPVVRYFIDGRYEGQFDQLPLTPGPIALFHGNENNVYFDDVKLSTDLAPAQFLTAAPVTGEDPSLVFAPGVEVPLKLTLHNHADVEQEARLGFEVSTFAGRRRSHRFACKADAVAESKASSRAECTSFPW